MADADSLKRVLTRADTLALAFGAMIGWSWVLLTGTWTEQAGTVGTALAFLLGGVVVVLIALTYAELAAAMPSVGGEHVYSLRALGPSLSFVCSWAIIFGYVAVTAFEAVALPYGLAQLFPGLSYGTLWTIMDWEVTVGFVVIGIVTALVLTWVNIRGVRLAAFFQQLVTGIIIFTGIVFLVGVSNNGAIENLSPLFVDGYRGVMTVLVMVPILFVGFDIIPQTAEEINLPQAMIGRLLVFSVVAAVFWYALMTVGVGFSLNAIERANSSLTTADASGAVWHADWARKLLIIGGIAGILTSWNAFLIGASRLIFAMAEAGMLPRGLARLHPRYGTPVAALWLLCALTCLSPWFGRPVLVWLINAGSFGVIIAYVLVTISFLVLRKKEPELPRPYRVPAGVVVGWLALLLSVSMVGLYLPGSPAALEWPVEWMLCLAWCVLGGVLWRFRGIA